MSVLATPRDIFRNALGQSRKLCKRKVRNSLITRDSRKYWPLGLRPPPPQKNCKIVVERRVWGDKWDIFPAGQKGR